MDELQLKLCDIQGRLFELSVKKKIPSAAFIKTFMTSDTAKALDSRYNRMQWMGEEYLLEEVLSSAAKNICWRKSFPLPRILFPLKERFIRKMYCTGSATSTATGTTTPAKAALKSCDKLLPPQ